MAKEIGTIRVESAAAGAPATIPPGHLEYHKDDSTLYVSDGTTKTLIATGSGSYAAENAQDDVGGILTDTATIDFTYTDATPAITADVKDNSITNAKLRDSVALSVIGRSANSTGDPADITGTDGQVLRVSGTTLGFGIYTYARRPSVVNPPASTHAYSDEFDTGTLDAKWTIHSTGTTNPAVAGTIARRTNLTTPIIDVATVPSWAMVQSDNSAAQIFGIRETVTLDTNATMVFRTMIDNRSISATNEGTTSFVLRNSADSNEAVVIYCQRNASGNVIGMNVQNDGAVTTVASSITYEDLVILPDVYLVLWKVSNVYYGGWFSVEGAVISYLGSVTKTGVTTFDRISLEWWTANETPSMVGGTDFFRYYASTVDNFINL